jgi:hypothetical protein
LPITTLRRAAAAALLVGAGLALAPEARAGGPPIFVPFGNKRDATLTGPADFQDFTINAEVGVDGWIGLTDDFDGGVATLVGRDGRPAGTARTSADPGGPQEKGFEFRPTVNGPWTVHVSPNNQTGSGVFPQTVGLEWVPDCRGDALTRCTIAPGKTKPANLGGANDNDAFTVKAKPGRRYVAHLEASDGVGLEVVDGKGRVVKSRRVRGGVADQPFLLPRAGGPYRVVVVGMGPVNHSTGSPYVLTLKAG